MKPLKIFNLKIYPIVNCAQLQLKHFTSQQWQTKSQLVFHTNCFGFPCAPWVNYVSFKYFVPAEYFPLSGVSCVEIQHPPQSSFPLTSCTRVFDYLSHKVRQVERKSQIQLVRVSSPKYLISWQTSTAGNKERSKVRAGKKEKTTTGAGFSSFHDSEITLFHLPHCKADSWKHCTTWWKLKFPYGK